MFDNLEQLMKDLEGVHTIPISIEIDDDGYLDRKCPWNECLFDFKVLLDDWENKVPDEVAYCPFCRHQAHSTAFNRPEQDEYFEQYVVDTLQQKMNQAMEADAAAFNRYGQSGFITLRFDVQTPLHTLVVPPTALDAMRMQIVCEACDCHFAVIGAAYFCPACGHNSARHTILQTFSSARASMIMLPTLNMIPDEDIRATMINTLIEGTLGSLVTAFQRYAEAEYPRLPHYLRPPRRNAFQRINDGNTLWVNAGGTAYTAILNAIEMDQLKLLFQQRHLLAHQQGIVDQDYITNSGDLTYAVGQHLVIREQQIFQFVDLLEKLVYGLSADLPS